MATGSNDGAKIRVGVSLCLLGEHVRYDAGHKHDRYVADVLGRYFDFVPVCPEVELGLGVPRPTLRLERDGDRISMVEPSSGKDRTRAMNRYAAKRARGLSAEGLRGYIFKRGSPSCGVYRVKAYTRAGVPAPSSRGLFAQAVSDRMPLLPLEEEGRLSDPRLREAFIERVFAYHRLQELFSERWKIADLVAFQAREKLFVMAHSPSAQRDLGRLVAAAKSSPRGALRDAYSHAFMRAIEKPITRGRHVNVLQHMAGYFKDRLGSLEKRQLELAIGDFRDGKAPLIVAVGLFRYLAHVHEVEYLTGQSYLEPHPRELMLRNHV